MSTAEHSTRVSKKAFITLLQRFLIRSSTIESIALATNICIFFTGSRATSVFRFGFISLDLISIILQDSGEYLCRVVSSTGVAESRATLSVTRE